MIGAHWIDFITKADANLFFKMKVSYKIKMLYNDHIDKRSLDKTYLIT